MKNLRDKIIDKLKEYDVEVFSEFKSDDETIILATNISLALKGKDILVNFHIDSKPCYAARLLMIIQEIKEIKEITIGDDFLFDEEGKFLDGQEASDYSEKYKKDVIIQDFMATQSKLFYLNTAVPYNC